MHGEPRTARCSLALAYSRRLPPLREALCPCAALVLVLLSTGCAGWHRPEDPSGKLLSTMVADLEAQAVPHFSATAVTAVDFPGQGEMRFRSTLECHRPSTFLLAAHHALGTRIFEMAADGTEWSVRSAKGGHLWYADGLVHLEGRSYPLPPIDWARELFYFEQWQDLGDATLHLKRYDGRRRYAQLLVEDERGVVRRRLWLQGTPWRVVKSVLYQENGRRLLTVCAEGHHEVDGILFAGTIEMIIPRLRSHVRLEGLQPRFDLGPRVEPPGTDPGACGTES